MLVYLHVMMLWAMCTALSAPCIARDSTKKALV